MFCNRCIMFCLRHVRSLCICCTHCMHDFAYSYIFMRNIHRNLWPLIWYCNLWYGVLLLIWKWQLLHCQLILFSCKACSNCCGFEWTKYELCIVGSLGVILNIIFLCFAGLWIELYSWGSNKTLMPILWCNLRSATKNVVTPLCSPTQWCEVCMMGNFKSQLGLVHSFIDKSKITAAGGCRQNDHAFLSQH